MPQGANGRPIVPGMSARHAADTEARPSGTACASPPRRYECSRVVRANLPTSWDPHTGMAACCVGTRTNTRGRKVPQHSDPHNQGGPSGCAAGSCGAAAARAAPTCNSMPPVQPTSCKALSGITTLIMCWGECVGLLPTRIRACGTQGHAAAGSLWPGTALLSAAAARCLHSRQHGLIDTTFRLKCSCRTLIYP